MKSTGRLALFVLFAAIGVGLAIYVGAAATSPEQDPSSKAIELAAVVGPEADAAKADGATRNRGGAGRLERSGIASRPRPDPAQSW